MSKKRNAQPVNSDVVLTPDAPEAPATVTFPVVAAPTVTVPAPTLKLMDVDKLQLDLAKEKRSTALAEAKTALANNEKAELAFKYVVLQIYMKYGLTDADAISETGEIVKNGAVRQTSGH